MENQREYLEQATSCRLEGNLTNTPHVERQRGFLLYKFKPIHPYHPALLPQFGKKVTRGTCENNPIYMGYFLLPQMKFEPNTPTCNNIIALL